MWVKQLLKDIEYQYDDPIVLKVNIQAAIRLTKIRDIKRTKHIDIRYHFIREKVINNESEIQYISTDVQLVDLLTKAIAKDRFRMLREYIGIH